MTTDTTIDATVDNLLSLADVALADVAPAALKPAAMTAKGALAALPPAWRHDIEAAGRKALYAALGAGKTQDEAVAAAEDAAGAEFDRLNAPAPTLTPEVELPTPAVLGFGAPPVLPVEPAVLPPGVSEAGRARSQRDVDALNKQGFAMRSTLYERGMPVVSAGVDNARKSRCQYDALPLVGAACDDLVARVESEHRRIVLSRARDVSMDPMGRIVLGAAGTFDVTENGFEGLCEILGYGGAKYLRDKCQPHLRAHNVNAQRSFIAAAEDARTDEALDAGRKAPPAREFGARVRDRAASCKDGVVVDPGGPEVFAAVSTDYPTFDADKIAAAFKLAMPADARGTVRYDPATTGTRFEALFQTTVEPEDFVCGEVFRTGIRVRANDSGDGSIVVRAVAFQNLCLNLLVIDRAGREIARIPHVGTVAALAAEFGKALAKAARALAPFMKQWGYACKEDLAARLIAEDVKLPSSPDEIMRGIFAGVLGSRRVRFPRLPGMSRQGVLDALVASWRNDVSSATHHHRGVTRAAVVNAITATAQQWTHAVDPWATDGIELDAAKLLWGHGAERPAPLAFVDLSELAADDVAESPASA